MDRPIEFVYDDIVVFSNHFSIPLGRGGTGKIYQGQIPRDNRYGLSEMLIAIKRATLDTENREEIKRQFQTEKDCLEKLSHANIIKLIGFCFNDEERFLILEYCAQGNVGRNIEGLNWEATINIIVKLAEAIQYVHALGEGVHGDISLGNVLLTENLEPKLSDFGTFINNDDLNHQKPTSMTLGFTDPQNMRDDRMLSPDDDVYAFAMVMMRMITKTRNVTDEESAIGSYEYAKSKFEKEGTLVHHMLLGSGCSPGIAKSISELVLELIEDSSMSNEVWKDYYLQKLADNEIEEVEPPPSGERIARPPIRDVAIRLKLLIFS